VSLTIPECELVLCLPEGEDGEPVAIVNRPQSNRDVRSWTRLACDAADRFQALLTFQCDTAEEAEQIAGQAAKLLHRHRRMALERLLGEPRDRARGGLS
jgi:hypothetical protein